MKAESAAAKIPHEYKRVHAPEGKSVDLKNMTPNDQKFYNETHDQFDKDGKLVRAAEDPNVVALRFMKEGRESRFASSTHANIMPSDDTIAVSELPPARKRSASELKDNPPPAHGSPSGIRKKPQYAGVISSPGLVLTDI